MNKDLIDFIEKILSKPNATYEDLKKCIRLMCNNALDLGYCDMRDCKDCKTFKVCGLEKTGEFPKF